MVIKGVTQISKPEKHQSLRINQLQKSDVTQRKLSAESGYLQLSNAHQTSDTHHIIHCDSHYDVCHLARLPSHYSIKHKSKVCCEGICRCD